MIEIYQNKTYWNTCNLYIYFILLNKGNIRLMILPNLCVSVYRMPCLILNLSITGSFCTLTVLFVYIWIVVSSRSTVKSSMKAIISDKHFISYMVVTVYTLRIFSLSLFFSTFLCFLSLMVSQSVINLMFSIMSLLKAIWVGEALGYCDRYCR